MMNTIPGYHNVSEIHRGMHAVICRALRDKDKMPVVLKILKDEYPPPDILARFRQEFEITMNLQGVPGVVKMFEMEKHLNSLITVMEDFDAVSLQEFMHTQPLTLLEKVSLAIEITRCLEKIHAADVIHKDIKPANILINSSTQEIKVIDFGISTRLLKENPIADNLNLLEGTPSYIAPEQTGRMNRSVDFRADFYSLGITFYELFTGRLPFTAQDAQELICCHIAQIPTPPHVCNSIIPQPLSAIVMKLMAKDPDERYQSARGILADLQKCGSQLEKTGEIALFPLGQDDVQNRLLLSEKLYGREKEIETLLVEFDGVAQSQRKLMLVAGHSGIGKTVLVQELFKPLTKRCGRFGAGKFDQFQRHMPYMALVEAFKNLTRQLLAESAEQLDYWKQELLTALGPNGPLIVDMLPQMELIIGKPPNIVDLPSGEERQNRFNLAFQKLVSVFAKPEHPLVLFLDDLQWSDLASIRLLHLFMTSPEIECLYIIGAYRDNEIYPAHPLLLTLEQIRKDGGAVSELSLGPLTFDHVTQLIADTLRVSPNKVQTLSKLVCDKTEGNPFFINEFLTTLHAENLLTLNMTQGGWQWDLARIEAQEITANVADMMAKRIQKLDPPTQEVIKLAACIGNPFELDLLSIATEKSGSDILQLLHSAIVMGIIIPLDKVYRSIQYSVLCQTEGQAIRFKFAHDKIQQAAYSLISDADKETHHLGIGKRLLQKIGEEKRDERVFEIVHHLNYASARLQAPQERLHLAELNLIAGEKAKSSAAYDYAMKYLNMGMKLLQENESQEAPYELKRDLLIATAEAAYLKGDIEKMSELTNHVLEFARTPIEKTKAYHLRILGHAAKNDPQAAIKTALEFLALLGISFDENPTKLQLIAALLKTKLVMAGKSPDDLLNLKEMQNPQIFAAISTMRSIAAVLLESNPKLMARMIFKQVQLILKHGNSTWSGSVFASYGILLCGVLGATELGYQMGDLALKLIEKYNATAQKCRTIYVVNCFERHCKEHLKDTLPSLKRAYEIGIENGDFEYSAFCLHIYCQHSLFIGSALTELEKEVASYSQAIRQLHQEKQYHYNTIFHQTVLNLLGRSKEPCQLIGEAINEDILIPQLERLKDRSGIFGVYLMRLILSCIFQRFQQAVLDADRALEHLSAVPGMFIFYRFHFYDSLARLKTAAQSDAAERKAALKRVAANQKKQKIWARHAPMNYLHLFTLIDAEIHSLRNKAFKAAELYHQAVMLAKEYGYTGDEALACELASQFFYSQGNSELGRTYFADACYAYQKWGALAKLNALEDKGR